METYIVITTYNEVENLERLLEQIFELHPNFKVIIVDDNSPDGTGKVADAISCQDPRVLSVLSEAYARHLNVFVGILDEKVSIWSG